MTTRPSIITDWRVREEDLPDVAPGDEYEHIIRPQKFIILHRIGIRDMTLVRLEIGRVKNVPFELESTDGPSRTYRLKGLNDSDLKKRLVNTGAAVATINSIAIVPALEIRLFLRNEGDAPAKVRAALFVQEEIT